MFDTMYGVFDGDCDGEVVSPIVAVTRPVFPIVRSFHEEIAVDAYDVRRSECVEAWLGEFLNNVEEGVQGIAAFGRSELTQGQYNTAFHAANNTQ
ncbi:hypothetical protein AUR64_04325 [Haloprofundus marisrubri]|uniref:Uncharacterized protein n=1 Tax=Haloprofundus marisrubri TaxID=1514971 RepID=A0A0W1RDH5_9EURY|nr:hypothetical protein AUR64_04325 [Haloprofundus marisrubri]